jgi:hypothetical protein
LTPSVILNEVKDLARSSARQAVLKKVVKELKTFISLKPHKVSNFPFVKDAGFAL